jgi:spermidine synthase
MKPFVDMTKILSEGESGEAKIDFFEVDAQASAWTAFGGGRDYVPEGKYARLRVKGELMMTNTRMEQATNYGVVGEARGDVLIAGLGIGMILVPILAKREVKTVTVVEKYRGVIDLVGPKVASPKLNIIEADIMEWTPPKGHKWDTIYFDIWPTSCTEDLKDMGKLHRRFAKKKNPGAWMESWNRSYLMSQKRRGY